MKNVLIGLLAIGLGVSLYFNFNKTKVNSLKPLPQNGKARISFFSTKPGASPTRDMGSDTTMLGSMQVAEYSVDSLGNGFLKGFCCPIPPRDTSSNPTEGPLVDLQKLVKVEIKLSEK